MRDIITLKEETKSFQNKLHKETVFFIDVLLIVIQYPLANKLFICQIVEANHYLSLSSDFIHKTKKVNKKGNFHNNIVCF